MPLIYDEKNIRDTEEYLFELYGLDAPTEDEIRGNLLLGYCTWDCSPTIKSGVCYYYLVSTEKPDTVIGYCFVTPTFDYMTEPVEFNPDVYLEKELINEVDEIGH